MTDWPREIWMAEREEHDQGVVTAVLSEHATVARFPGDKDREREFHHYVDGDIHESTEKYHRHQLAAKDAEIGRLREALRFYRDAWTDDCQDHGVPVSKRPSDSLCNDWGDRARDALGDNR